MFSKVLIANRGEIALRVIAACKEMGLKTVAVHSEADRDSLHVRYADDDVCIGPAASKQSYLSISSIIAAAEITGADAIHPGYGFLSENPHFAEIVNECGLTFIGPPAEAIRLMGDKARARETAKNAGVPIIPGSEGSMKTADEAAEVANAIGYPVILKAAAGGGGRGMRICWDPSELHRQYETARNEAERAFGSGEVYLEKYLERPRHIEIQVFADNFGRVVALGERECSIQRRHQKLIEESPSPALTDELRKRMGDAAIRLCQAVNYVNAGTIEFLFQDGEFYFMEMNTRIQVEHPVTEEVTGIDLVKEQIRVAAGERLTVPEGEFRLRGHAMEFRVNAEDPVTFAPNPGKIRELHLPGGPGVRVDTHIYRDYVVPPHYDSLLAKLVVRGKDRLDTIARGRRALEQFVVEGVKTTIPLHRAILNNEQFIRGDISTRFMDNFSL
ncbi:MAG: acetyl-CoA carboxylase biotin carboxylase subunit [Acidobacteria bacterium]|nr:acetyl-CoA carboxylase biotin carboxylase subunit [Acidobacteriota bacterium]MBV9477799.1 acetyl-CoA carboxylase biotin carboxylase subunit [Acidobacteriota bacterium]